MCQIRSYVRVLAQTIIRIWNMIVQILVILAVFDPLNFIIHLLYVNMYIFVLCFEGHKVE